MVPFLKMSENNCTGENSNQRIDNLFKKDGCRDWIVTKEKQGKIKLTICKDDEYDNLHLAKAEWIEIDIHERKIDSATEDISLGNKGGTARFFVKDLLICQSVNSYFTFKDITFVEVFVCGTVVSLSTRFDKYSIVLDDGTSSITCLIKKEQFAALHMNKEDKQEQEAILKNFIANPDDRKAEVNAIFANSILRMEKKIPDWEDLKLGDIVSVVGNLSEFNNFRYIFIKSIEKPSEQVAYQIKYLEEMIFLYDNDFIYPSKF